jgi:hypothetical protein
VRWPTGYLVDSEAPAGPQTGWGFLFWRAPAGANSGWGHLVRSTKQLTLPNTKDDSTTMPAGCSYSSPVLRSVQMTPVTFLARLSYKLADEGARAQLKLRLPEPWLSH